MVELRSVINNNKCRIQYSDHDTAYTKMIEELFSNLGKALKIDCKNLGRNIDESIFVIADVSFPGKTGNMHLMISYCSAAFGIFTSDDNSKNPYDFTAAEWKIVDCSIANNVS